jgi:hypothetical protein
MTAPARRLEDRIPSVLIFSAGSAGRSGSTVTILESDPRPTDPDRPADAGSAVVLLDPGAGDLLILTGAELHRRPRAMRHHLPDLALSEARAMRRRRLVARRRHHFSNGFVTFVERMNRVIDEAEMCDVVVDSAADLLNSYAAILYMRDSGSSGAMRPAGGLLGGADPGVLDVVLPPCHDPGPVRRSDTAPGQPFAGLAPLFDVAAHVACACIGDRGLLVVVERRADRALRGEDWFRLQTIARQTRRTLEHLAFEARSRLAR